MMNWVYRVEYFPLNRSEFEAIRSQMEAESAFVF